MSFKVIHRYFLHDNGSKVNNLLFSPTKDSTESLNKTILTGEDIHGEECKKIGGQDLIITNYLNQNEVANLMNICDLFVFPSLHETGPQVVLEAKSCGALCVVSPKGGGRKIRN